MRSVPSSLRVAPQASRTAARSPAMEAVRSSLQGHAPYVGLVGLYVISGVLILPAIGREIPYAFTDIYRMPVVLTLIYLALTLLLGIVVDVLIARRRPANLATWSRIYDRWFGTRRLVGMLIVLCTLPALLDVMLGYRMVLTDIQPFAHDVLFMRWDEWLHLGRHPWELLQPLLGESAITVALDRIYVYGWFVLLWVGTIWQAVHGKEPIRLQYFLSFAACWILLGTIGAITLSSAGPVYFGRVTGLEDPYAPLFAYLASVDAETPLWALANQERLWLTYRTWGGITAMPSMHLAITTVVTLAAVRTDRRLAFLVGPVWLLMLLASVHLGWHYAVDSYVGILAAALLWWLCGRGARRWLEEAPGEAA